MMRLHAEGGGLDVSATPLVEAPGLARLANIDRALIKLESERWLGSFKSLGGGYAALQLLAEASAMPFEVVAAGKAPAQRLPRLICASDGNHGLAVAAAAQAAGAAATVYLHEAVDPVRAARICNVGARIEWVRGTYDDAVTMAERAAAAGDGILAPDTTDRADSRAVSLVMEGYGVIARELAAQLRTISAVPTHLFVQAGVGGLAASLATGINGRLKSPSRIVVVEPASAACVMRALSSPAIERFPGDLQTSADMLACGVACAPAVAALRAHKALGMTISETDLERGRVVAEDELGIFTTTSGAAGIAGLLAAASEPETRRRLEVTAESVVGLILSEGRPEE